jgi:type III pantothenate kinase
MARAEFLLIDNSNSFTKFALASRDAVGPSRKIPTAKLDPPMLAHTLRGWKFDRVVLCSVVPKKAALISKALAAFPLCPVSHRTRLGVGIDYPRPATIGADRLANAAAALHFFGAPVVVVDFGTAVTFDIIDSRGCYAGGVIAPGLEAMTDYLHQRTALLPRISLIEPPAALGKSTKHAMLAGAIFGYRGLVREILRQIKSELGARRLHVAATGGYAELIASGVKEIHGVAPGLTLEGLRLIGNLNFPPP